MSLFKRPGSPFWWYSFSINGVRFRGSTGTEKRRAAEIYVEQIRASALAESSQRAADGRKHLTVNEATARYWKEHAVKLPSAKVIWGKLCLFNDIIGGQIRLADINDEVVAAYVTRRRSEAGDATVNRDLTMLRAMLNRADRRWRVAVGKVDWRAHRSIESAGRVRWLSEQEEERLFEALRPDFHPLVKCAIATGLRLSNLITLTWSQVDFRERILTVRQKSRRPGGEHHVLPLTDSLVALLRGEVGKHQTRVFTYRSLRRRLNVQKGDYVPFAGSGGWAAAWRSALKAAGISDFRWHDLRHTAGTRMQRRTGNLAATAKLLGHRSAQSTLRYSHVSTDDLRSQMEMVENRGGKSPGTKRSQSQRKSR